MKDLVPWTTISQSPGGRPGNTNIVVKAVGRDKVSEARRQIIQFLRRRRGTAPGRPNGFGITSRNDWIDEQVKQALAMHKAYPNGAADFEKAMKAEGMLSLFGDSGVDSNVSLEGVHSAKAFLARAAARQQTGKLDGSIADLTEVIRLEPKSIDAWTRRGTAHCDHGDFDQAIADFSEVIRLAPANLKARIARGVSYGKKGDHDKAIADFSTAIAADPKYPLAYGYRAVDYYRKGELDHALADCNEAIRLDAKDAVSHRNRGMIHVARGHFDKAIADCSEALWLDPIDADAYHWRGLAYEKSGDSVKAGADTAWPKKLREKPRRTGHNPLDMAALNELRKVECLAIKVQGEPIVKALHEYRNTHGLWPQRVEDFAEKYLARKDLYPWQYEWTSSGWRIICFGPDYEGVASYYMVGEHGSWALNYAGSEDDPTLRQPPPEPGKLTSPRLIDATIAEFRRRIAREPEAVCHRDGLISFLIRNDRLDNAEKECLALAARSPKEVWPIETLARVTARRGRPERAEKPLKTFVAANPELSNYVTLVNFYRSLGRHGEALDAIRESLKLPEVAEPIHGDHPEWSLFSFGGYAYEQKQYQLVLTLADAWESADRQIMTGDRSYHAMRTAAYLALGKFDDAQEHYERAARYAKRAGHAPLAGKLDELRKAIGARQSGFVYDGLKEPSCYSAESVYY